MVAREYQCVLLVCFRLQLDAGSSLTPGRTEGGGLDGRNADAGVGLTAVSRLLASCTPVRGNAPTNISKSFRPIDKF